MNYRTVACPNVFVTPACPSGLSGDLLEFVEDCVRRLEVQPPES